MRVLLVDDEEELVSALAERLNLRGVEAEWTTNGKAALQKAETERFDIAVLDIKMPKINGLELRDRLMKKYPHMKFIFLTGYGSEIDYLSVTEEDGDLIYLMKPIEIDILIDKIKQLNSTIRGSE